MEVAGRQSLADGKSSLNDHKGLAACFVWLKKNTRCRACREVLFLQARPWSVMRLMPWLLLPGGSVVDEILQNQRSRKLLKQLEISNL